MIDIDELIKSATLSKDKVALNAYKNIKAEIQKNQTAKNAKSLTSELQLQIISSYSKKLEEAIKQFSEAHRDDLVSEYTSELEVVKKLLPEPVSELQIDSFIKSDEEFFDKYWFSEFVDETDMTYMELQIPKKEMGNAIKYLKSKFPTADGKMISKIIKKYIV